MQDNGIQFGSPARKSRAKVMDDLKSEPIDGVIANMILNDEYLLEQIRDLRKEVAAMRLELQKYKP